MYTDVTAIKITAPVLKTELFGDDPEIWFAFKDDFISPDGCTVYFASELKELGRKSRSELIKIQEVKLAMKGGKVLCPEE